MVEKSHTAGDLSGHWYPSVLRPFHDIGRQVADFFAPDADAVANSDQYEINIELPGVSLEDIQIDVQGDSLTIHGEKKVEREEKGKTYFFSERAHGSFERSFRLPANARAGQSTAQFKDGVLSIRIPKADASPHTTRRIDITGG